MNEKHVSVCNIRHLVSSLPAPPPRSAVKEADIPNGQKEVTTSHRPPVRSHRALLPTYLKITEPSYQAVDTGPWPV